MSKNMNKRATKHKSAPENSIHNFPTVSPMSSDSIVKGIIDDIFNKETVHVIIDQSSR
jgi:ATP-dependent exoDNAse (exonuclease V) beta subunit